MPVMVAWQKALYWSKNRGNCMRALSKEALTIARRMGYSTGIAYALHSLSTSRCGSGPHGRSALWPPRRCSGSRTSTGDCDIELMADIRPASPMPSNNDPIEKVDGYIAGDNRLVEELQLPHLLGYVESINATPATPRRSLRRYGPFGNAPVCPAAKA